jgi:tetratricopeptide (TPR) repeat protein
LRIDPIAAGVDPQAYDVYLQGRYAQRQRGPEDLKQATILFSRAIAIDPKFAAAYSGLASVHSSSAMRGYVPTMDGFTAAEIEVNRALALDPQSLEAFYVRGMSAVLMRHDWAAAEEAFAIALRLNPNDPNILQGAANLEMLMRRFGTAVEYSRRALDADPLSMPANYNLAVRLSSASRFDEAEAQFEKTLALNPGVPQVTAFRALNLMYKGEPEAALALLDQEASPAWRATALPLILFALDKPEEARVAVDELAQSYGDVAAFQVAEAYAFMGMKPEALHWLNAAYEMKDAGITQLVSVQALRGLYGEPEFKILLEKLEFPENIILK